jgi:dTDP-4-amino-4,6-dideoxygalactose transaminase
MKKLDRFLARRRAIAKRYDEAFADCDNIVTPYQLPDTNSGWHLYIIQVLNCDRKAVFEKLRENGIGVNVHYIPVYQHPYYRQHGYQDVCCPVAEEVYSHIISIPIYPGLTDAQQDEVIQKIKALLSKDMP